MLQKEQKREILEKRQRHTLDTGSPEAQIALFSARITDIMHHLQRENKNDVSSLRGLQQLVSKRKRQMKYLAKKNPERYKSLIQELGIRG